ncbi:hypothetical protein [Streptomyces sp. COG20]|uniref:hypothetical protein n=1 Tax=Streptomyces sp. COG20 TaxID=2838871 RepID=UPI001EFD997A|nr:hypothetical protein [Streptomyces sp. COG20]
MTGAALAAVAVGIILEDVPVFVAGGGVLALLILFAVLGGKRRPAGGEPPAGRLALARIEDLRATGGESADVPVKFRLTVAPEPEDARPAYRVKITQHINLVDLPAYRPRGIAVVEYRPDKPWDVRIVTRPTPEWARRAEEAEIDSAPDSTLVSNPDVDEGSWCLLVLLAFLAGAVLVVLLFRGPLFTAANDEDTPPDSPSKSSSTSRTFTTSTTVSGPSSSLLASGRMRATAMELEGRVDTAYVTEVTIEDHRMAVSGDSTRPPTETFHLQSLPYELLPTLVREGPHHPRHTHPRNLAHRHHPTQRQRGRTTRPHHGDRPGGHRPPGRGRDGSRRGPAGCGGERRRQLSVIVMRETAAAREMMPVAVARNQLSDRSVRTGRRGRKDEQLFLYQRLRGEDRRPAAQV